MVDLAALIMTLFWPTSCLSHRTAHHQRGVCLVDDLKAMSPVEPGGWIILEHEEGHRLCCPAPLLQQQAHDLCADPATLVSGRNIELLQEDFVPCLSKLHPADLLTIEDYDPGIGRTPQAGKLRYLLIIHPPHPSRGQGFDCLYIQMESEGVVG